MGTVRANPGAAAQAPDDAELARRAARGDRDAFGLLFERWFDRSYDVAWHVVHNRDTAAEVAQDAFATAWRQISTLRQPESFGGWLLRITRNRGLNRLARERRSSPIGDHGALEALDSPDTPDGVGARAGAPTARPAAGGADDELVARERDDLVWVASVALGPDDASLLDLHVRHGLAPPELADELGVQPNTVHQRLFRLKRRLGEAIGAWMLWRGGRPSCPELGAALASSAVGAGAGAGAAFTRATAAAIVRHARACPGCDADRDLRLSPEALFGAVPLVVAGPVLRAEAAAALEGAGVPASTTGTGGSTTGAGGPGGSGEPESANDEQVTEPEGQAPGGGERDRPVSGRARPVLRWVAVVGVTALVAVVAVVAGEAGDGPEETTSADRPPRESPDGASAGASTSERSPSTPAKGEPAAPPPTEPPVTTAPEPTDPAETTTTTTPPPGPPVIGGFRASPGDGQCSAVGQASVSFAWSTTDATTVTLGPVGGAGEGVAPAGSTTRCVASGSTWALTATGPGGTTTATATAP